MIHALTSENYKNITKVSILDAKDVFYPLKYVLQKRDIVFDEDLAVVIKPMLEDIKYPASSKATDAGVLRDYKIEISINNQLPETIEQLERLVNRKVIVVLHHNYGKIILGCNEMPLEYLFNDDNTTNPQGDNGFTVTCRGNAYFLKVSI
ncbi:hypothetical protein H8R23_05060 [Flavobacterium sp. F-380]|uniref:Uncharacterized protein n=1 Tax=Flavobacterium kayseriense TaxID=2764714 RepID=A0ABR7J5M0_9FLAO|nr:hypothetical protein [Flavobacterium kayseriense]MBC5840767.1 hypothetical protein [Flavobacterium kayseriense]MBC5846563.1 hypothetical protein [Flavobacterium kayseriense]